MNHKSGDNTVPGFPRTSSKEYSCNPEEFLLAGKQSALRLRSDILFLIRRFFRERDYLEVETPILIREPAPEPYIDAMACGSRYLQTSPELCMKRLLASGYSRIFQICRCFREAERGDRHLPEFSMLEWYVGGKDYRFLMEECEALFCFLANVLFGKEEITFQGKRIDLAPPWERLSVSEAFQRFGGMSVREALADDCYEEILVNLIEPRLGYDRPVFLYDYPLELAALARAKQNNPSVAERFELYILGMELACT